MQHLLEGIGALAAELAAIETRMRELAAQKAAILESLDEAQKLIQQTIHDQQTRRPSILISSLTEIDEHTRGCLTTAQIIFIEDIANMQESAIQKIPGIGGSGLAGIRKALVTRGLDFARAA